MPSIVYSLFLVVTLLLDCHGSGSGDTPSSSPEPAGTQQIRPPGHVLLLGLDGVEWDLVLQMLNDGRLPHLRSLMERGSYGELGTLVPTLSPAIWTTVATGVSPAKHGIRGFKKASTARLVTSQDRRVEAFWNILSDEGRRVDTVGWWATWPVEKVNGLMVAQVNVGAQSKGSGKMGFLKGSIFQGLEDQVYPPERQDEILAVADGVVRGLDQVVTGIFGAPWPSGMGEVPDRLWESSMWAVRADAIYHQVALRQMSQQQDWDLLAVYFGGTDVLGHRFWRYLYPGQYRNQPTEAELGVMAHLITDYYQHTDKVVGELMAAAPPDTTVIILSDHGMKATNTNNSFQPGEANMKLISGGHPRGIPAFFLAAGPGIRASGVCPSHRSQIQQVGTVYDILPTMFELLRLPLALDLEGEVMEGIFQPGFVRDNPERRPTFTEPGWYGSRPHKKSSASFDKERQEQLRSLGYIL